MGGQSGSWTPTKRRGPIAAEFQGPGPAAIGLPSLFGSKWNQIMYILLRVFFREKKYLILLNKYLFYTFLCL